MWVQNKESWGKPAFTSRAEREKTSKTWGVALNEENRWRWPRVEEASGHLCQMLLKGQQSGQWLGRAGIIRGLFESMYCELWRCRSWSKADSEERGRQGSRDGDSLGKISRLLWREQRKGTLGAGVGGQSHCKLMIMPPRPSSVSTAPILWWKSKHFDFHFLFLQKNVLRSLFCCCDKSYTSPPLSRLFNLWRDWKSGSWSDSKRN